jgi:hypothetical protein
VLPANTNPAHTASSPSATLCIDSSQFGMGCIAAQEVHGKLCPLEYYSATHTDQAKRYGSSERECLAIIKSIEHFAPLINGSRFKCINPMVPAPTTMTVDNTFDFKAYDY